MAERKGTALWDGAIVKGALVESMRKFDPRIQARNPVMFVVEVTALAVTLILLRDFFEGRGALAAFEFQIAPGCGLQCCSPISPRRWLKGAARPRPTACAKHAPKPRPSWFA